MSASRFVPSLVESWRLAVVGSSAPLGQEQRRRAFRSANSRLAQAMCCFTPAALRQYRTAGFQLPDMPAFLAAARAARSPRVNKLQYHPPDDAIIKRTLEDWIALETTDLNTFLAIALELSAGLRKGEVAQAKWSWLVHRGGRPWIDSEADVKDQSGRIVVPMLQKFWLEVERVIASHPEWVREGFIIQGSSWERADLVFNRVSDFLRSHGWQTQKTNHALRAYAGSLVAQSEGIYAASKWLRHKSISTTEESYLHYFTLDRVGASIRTLIP